MRAFIVEYHSLLGAKLIDIFLGLTTSKYAHLASHFQQQQKKKLHRI